MKGGSALSERLTIDDAIMHAKKVAEEKYLQGMLCHTNPNDSELDKCIECGKEHEQLAKWLEKLKQYLYLEEQGLLLRLPCKVGDIVFVLENALTRKKSFYGEKKIFFASEFRPKYVKCKIVGIYLKNKGKYIKVRYEGDFEEKYFDSETGYDYRVIPDSIDMNFVFSRIGKTVFLTQSEAEEKLRELEGVKCQNWQQ